MKTIHATAVLVSLILLSAGCNESSHKGSIGTSCMENDDCLSGLCINHTCIEPCTPTSCGSGQYCANSGICEAFVCSDQMPCQDKTQVCQNGTCVFPECSEDNPCKDNKICSQNRCVYECQNSEDCKDNKICSQNQCIYECQDSKDCKDNKICSQNQCIYECQNSEDCKDNKICSQNQCVYECTAAKPCADATLICIDGQCKTECDESRPCHSDGYTCVEGRCIVQPADACKKSTCPSGTVCGEDGVCFTGECSAIDTCPADLFCQNSRCVTRDEIICYADSDCGNGYACDEKKCVPDSSCSMTRTCADDRICHNGICTPPVSATCSETQACPDANQQCIEGACVSCNCNPDEICTLSGSCVKAGESISGKVSEGDDCVYASFQSHCDNNRKFSCIDGKVRVTNCGAKACANAPEEGIGCYETCQNDGDFYGQCIGWVSPIAFTKKCSTTTDNKRVWSLQNGFEDCTSGCKNGRCLFVPPEFGTSCTETTYPDACQGNWLTYCYSGYSAGTDCTTYSEKHVCALPSQNAQNLYHQTDKLNQLVGTCALPCSDPGKLHRECIKDSEGNVFSMRYLCATTTSGKLVDFEAGYVQCEKGCRVETGLCLE